MANATTKFAIDKFQEYGKAKGWNVTVTDTNADFNQLVSRIEDAVTQKVDAIVLGMGDPAQMTKGLDAAQGANIPVFGSDAGTGRACYSTSRRTTPHSVKCRRTIWPRRSAARAT